MNSNFSRTLSRSDSTASILAIVNLYDNLYPSTISMIQIPTFELSNQLEFYSIYTPGFNDNFKLLVPVRL